LLSGQLPVEHNKAWALPKLYPEYSFSPEIKNQIQLCGIAADITAAGTADPTTGS